jgi:hypothetical protein
MDPLPSMNALISCLLTVLVCAEASARQEGSVSALIEKAVARTKSTDEQIWNHTGHLRFTFVQVTENLGENRAVKEREERRFQIYPIHGTPYARLVEIDGRPLTPKEQEKEQQKEDEFRRDAAEDGKEGQRKDGREAKDRLVFEEIVKKYRFHLENADSIDGRATQVVSFEPLSGDLPEEHPLDGFLNQTHGRLWIDEESDEVRKIEFSTVETIKLLWGIAGNISAVEGFLERRPMAGLDLWAPSRFEVYLKGRTGFSSFHRNVIMEWHDYEIVPDEADGILP